MLEDQLNIQIMTDSGKRVVDLTERISRLETSEQFAMLVPEMGPIHGDFLRRCQARINRTKAGTELREELERAVEELKAATPKHVYSAQAHFGDPTNESVKAEFQLGCKNVIELVDLIISITQDIFARNAQFIGGAFAFRAPTTSKQDKLFALSQEFALSSARVLEAAQNPEEDGDIVFQTFQENSLSLCEAAREFAAACEDPVRRAIIERACAELDELIPQILEKADYCREHPEDTAALAELREMISRAQKLNDIINVAIRDVSPETAVALNAESVQDSMDALLRAIEAGDLELGEAELCNLEKNIDRQIAFLETMLANETDPVKRAAIQAQLDKLKAMKPQIRAACQRWQKDPKSMAHMKQIRDLLGNMKDSMEATTAPNLVADAINRSLAHEIDALIDVMQRKPENYRKEAAQHAKEAAADLKEMRKPVDDLKSLSGDEKRHEEIEGAYAEAQRFMSALVAATRDAILAPDDVEKMEALRVAGTNAKTSADELVHKMQLTPEEQEGWKRRVEAIAGTKKEIELPEPEQAKVEDAEQGAAASKLHVEGPVDDRIFAAAVSVEQNMPAPSDQAGHASSPQGQLLETTHEIAALMAQLAGFAAKQDKAGMIQTSRTIASKINKITKLASTVAGLCEDKTLRNEVNNNSAACGNHAVQLKIMAAVKAGMDQVDPSVEDQLVTAATGLANSVVATANACQSAAIHHSVRGKI